MQELLALVYHKELVFRPKKLVNDIRWVYMSIDDIYDCVFLNCSQIHVNIFHRREKNWAKCPVSPSKNQKKSQFSKMSRIMYTLFEKTMRKRINYFRRKGYRVPHNWKFHENIFCQSPTLPETGQNICVRVFLVGGVA